MPPISRQKKDKIAEQILHYLFSLAPQAQYTSIIAREIARDEEFTKSLLEELRDRGLVAPVDKNPLGTSYLRRQRWRLSNSAYQAYKSQQK